MRRELIFDPWIAKPDDQLHATIPYHVGTAASAVQPARSAATTRGPTMGLFLLLLLSLLRLLCRSRALGSLFLGLLLALLDNFGLGRSNRRFRCRGFRGRPHFFLSRGHGGHP